MNKYENGKIYKIVNDDIPDKVYYGSTIQKLNWRFNGHKCRAKKNNQGSSKKLFEKGEPRIELIEDYPCSSKRELLVRERFYIENNECVNIEIPSRSKKESRAIWYKENKEREILYATNYYQKNKEDKNLYSSNYYQKNKEIITNRKREKFNCECGGKYTYSSRARHKKTKKHLEFENKIDI